MKRFLTMLLVVLAIPALAQYGGGNGVYGSSAGPASQAEVNAGTNTSKFVSPATLAGAGLVSGLAVAKSMAISDQLAQNNLTAAYNDLSTIGVMTNLVSLGLLDPIYNPKGHVDTFLNPFSANNEQYTVQAAGVAGLNCRGTNFITVALPNLTNCYVVVWHWQNPTLADTFAQGVDGFRGQALMALYDTNTYAGFTASSIEEGNGSVLGIQVYASFAGTNFNLSQDPQNLTTNRASPMLNGQYDSRVPLGILDVEGLSVNTNGFCSVWYGGKNCIFNQGGMSTNVIHLGFNGPYNQLIVGGAGGNWFTNNTTYCTNFFGVIGGYAIFNTSAESTPQVALAAYKLATDLTRYTAATDFGGASLVNFAIASGFTSAGIALTNTVPWLYGQMNPTRLVICDAAPGSRLNASTNENNTFTNAWSPIAITGLNTNRFSDRIFETTGPDNDALNSVSDSAILSSWANFIDTPLSVAGIPRYIIDRGWDYSSSVSANLNWKRVQSMLFSNYVISGVIPWAATMSSNVMSVASKDNPPVHPDNSATYQAHQIAVGSAALCSFRPWPFQNWGAQWLTVQNPLVNDAGNLGYSSFMLYLTDTNGGTRYLQFTNTTPANGSALRWTNGQVYWGP